jgi:hypothetical protein
VHSQLWWTPGDDPVDIFSVHPAARYTATSQVYKPGNAAGYAGERDLVAGSAAGTAAAGYPLLEGDISQAIAAEQAVFGSAGTAGANLLGPLGTS